MRATKERSPFLPSLSFTKTNFHSQCLLTNKQAEEGRRPETKKRVDENEAPAAAAAKKLAPPSAADAVLIRLRSVLVAALAPRRSRQLGLGSRVVGTLFGHRRGHVHLAFQADARACPVVLIELATPTACLVREMSSGLVRVAFECQRRGKEAAPPSLVEEPLWRAYCNGKKCGYAVRRECGPADWKVLRVVEPVSMGAGVIPGGGGGYGSEGDVMYMRARFERVVGSKDSEAFYMMSPDGNGGGPELSVYFLRA